ncbi:hypothetical protein PVAG01_00657 [Phlyctema vagabunda]|uniref:2EXR domain-containing protein n=1 Tax=Phlyctema vagabunda TaxID=108571 RepID=A0ABR4PVB4_9HELO
MELPVELRECIWELTAQQERNVGIRAKSKPDAKEPGPFHFVAMQRPPAILHTCVEARKVGLRYYRLSFAFDSPEQDQKSEARI